MLPLRPLLLSRRQWARRQLLLLPARRAQRSRLLLTLNPLLPAHRRTQAENHNQLLSTKVSKNSLNLLNRLLPARRAQMMTCPSILAARRRLARRMNRLARRRMDLLGLTGRPRSLDRLPRTRRRTVTVVPVLGAVSGNAARRPRPCHSGLAPAVDDQTVETVAAVALTAVTAVTAERQCQVGQDHQTRPGRAVDLMTRHPGKLKEDIRPGHLHRHRASSGAATGNGGQTRTVGRRTVAAAGVTAVKAEPEKAKPKARLRVRARRTTTMMTSKPSPLPTPL